MITEIMSNRWFLIGAAVVVAVIAYKLFNRKDAALEEIEKEYEEVLTSDKYKVKGQYSE